MTAINLTKCILHKWSISNLCLVDPPGRFTVKAMHSDRYMQMCRPKVYMSVCSLFSTYSKLRKNNFDPTNDWPSGSLLTAVMFQLQKLVTLQFFNLSRKTRCAKWICKKKNWDICAMANIFETFTLKYRYVVYNNG